MVVEGFLKLVKNITLKIQEAYNLRKINSKKTILKHIVVSLLKMHDIKRNLESRVVEREMKREHSGDNGNDA